MQLHSIHISMEMSETPIERITSLAANGVYYFESTKNLFIFDHFSKLLNFFFLGQEIALNMTINREYITNFGSLRNMQEGCSAIQPKFHPGMQSIPLLWLQDVFPHPIFKTELLFL